MISYQYAYLLMGLVFFVVWLILFLVRKDIQKEMLIMSSIFALAGPPADFLYTKDWWKPLTLTNTVIGFESVIAGFMIGGVASAIYIDIFKKRVRIKKRTKREKTSDNFRFLFLLSLTAVLFFGTFYLFSFNSLSSTIVAMAIPTLWIYWQRKDLIKDSIITGLLLLGVAIFVYSAVEVLTPGWVNAFWLFKNVSHIVILNVPIDDVIWYSLGGAYLGPLYVYWQESKII